MKVRSDYEIVGVEHGIVFIRDLNLGRMSVTNDAESVLHTIRFTYGIDIRVVYQGSDGMWTEIVNINTGVLAGDYDLISFEPWHGIEWDILKR